MNSDFALKGKYVAYPKYKDSDDNYIGLIPDQWVSKNLRWEISAKSGIDEKIEGGEFDLFGANGVIGKTITASVTGDCGVVIIGRVGSAGAVTFVSRTSGVSDNALIIDNNKFKCPRFDFYLLMSLNLEELVSKNAQPLITASSIKSLRAGLPNCKDERFVIAQFLDHETAKIDTLIEKQKQLIKLLKEKRQAVISHAVTKGLSPDVLMRDSGVEWLGEVPKHWGVSSLGYYSTLSTGATPDRSKSNYWGGDIPWVKTGEVRYHEITVTEEHITSDGEMNSAVTLSPPGTLLMAMYGQGVTRGRVALLGTYATYNQACAAITPNEKLWNKYLRFFFMAAYHAIRDGGNETSQMNLNVDIVSKFKVTIPSIDEQHKIVSFLDQKLQNFENVIDKAESTIELMKERRTALISAAVTGKIDVRNWQAPEPPTRNTSEAMT